MELKWSPASPKILGADGRFTTFSSICWLYGKQLHNELGVPVGLVSSAKGGTNIGAWSPLESTESCNATGHAKNGGELGNTMIHPLSVGPMGLTSAIWSDPPILYFACLRCLMTATNSATDSSS